MPACRTKSREWHDLRNHKNRRSRRLIESNAGWRTCPYKSIAEKVLFESAGRVRFYNCYLLDIGTQCREPSRKTCRERADGQENNRDPPPRGGSYACARVFFQHDHFKSVTQSGAQLNYTLAAG
jgi:hypothetical protein